MLAPPMPQGFRPSGSVESAHFTTATPPFLRTYKRRGRKADGIRYEKRVHQYLERKFGWMYLASPWLRFLSSGETKWRWCQPDGLIIDPLGGRITLVEVKFQHTSDAWWQTRELYLPVLKAIMPTTLWTYSVVEVTRWYDPAVRVPDKVVLTEDLSHLKEREFGVHIWRP